MKNQSTFVGFEGLKVKLRGIHNDKDMEAAWTWMNDPEVTQYLLSVSPISWAAEKEYFAKVGLDPNHKKFAIEDKESGELIGFIDISKINLLHRYGTTGSVIGNKKYWSNGYGTDSKMLVLYYAFNTLNLKNVFSEVYDFNQRSLGALRNTGYKIIGRQKKSVFCNGKWCDRVFLQVSKKDFKKVWRKYYKKLRSELSK